MPTAVTVILVAGLMVGPACSSSGLKSRAGDAGVGSGGQVGNSTISGITGGSGGTIGPSGAGGSGVGGTAGMIGPGGTGGVNTGGTGGQGGAAGASTGAAGAGGIYGADAGGRMSASDAGRSNGNSGTGGQGDATDSPLSQGGMCGAIPGCNPGDQQVGFAPGSEYTDLSDCPAERECYSLGDNCGSILCVLPQGVHCNDSLSCNPGDTQIPQWDQSCVGYPSPCYESKLCTQTIVCRFGADAGVDASGKPEPDSSSPRVGAPHPQPCLPGEVLNFGEMCPCVAGPPLCSYSSCEPRGDGWCYTQCTPPQQGGSCAGGLICGPIMIFGGGDVGYNYYLCDGPIGAPVGGACRFNDDCNAGASCVTNTHCGDASVCSVCQN